MLGPQDRFLGGLEVLRHRAVQEVLLRAQEREVEPCKVDPGHLVTRRLRALRVGIGQGAAVAAGIRIGVPLNNNDSAGHGRFLGLESTGNNTSEPGTALTGIKGRRPGTNRTEFFFP